MPTFLVSDSISLAELAGRNLVVVTTDNRVAGDLLFLSDAASAHLTSNLGQRGNIDYDQIRRTARAGDGDKLHTLDIGGSHAVGNTVKFDAAGNLIDAGVTPGGGGGSGTVTSVALTVPAEFSVSGSPVTTSGTLAVAKATQSANLVYSGPSSGSAAAPTFRSLAIADLPSLAPGALILLEQHTASSSASLDFTTCVTSSYDDYLVEFINVVPATNAANLFLRMSIDGGSTYDSSGVYALTIFYINSGPGSGVGGNTLTGTSFAIGGLSNSANYGVCGFARLIGLTSAVYKGVKWDTVFWSSNPDITGMWVVGFYKNTTAVNAFRFAMTSGNIASGIIRVYGVAKTTVASPDFILVNGA